MEKFKHYEINVLICEERIINAMECYVTEENKDFWRNSLEYWIEEKRTWLELGRNAGCYIID